MIDQSHNVTDPIESMLQSAEAIVQAFAKALLVDREELALAHERNDTIIAKARVEAGGAYNALARYRVSDWRDRMSLKRKRVGLGAGIV